MSKPSTVVKAHSVRSIKSASNFSFWNISLKHIYKKTVDLHSRGSDIALDIKEHKTGNKTFFSNYKLFRINEQQLYINVVYIIILNFTMIPDVYCILESTARTESENKHATEICFVHMEIASLYLKTLSRSATVFWPYILHSPTPAGVTVATSGSLCRVRYTVVTRPTKQQI